MQIKIGGLGPVSYHNIAGVLDEFWRFHNIHFGKNRIKASWNSVYNFWDVTVERGPLFSWGHGSVEHQLAKWAENTQRIIAMCQKAEMRPNHGWTWEPIVNNVHIEEGASIVNNRIYCPAVRLFLFKDTLYGDQ
jgi:hypothetical protein